MSGVGKTTMIKALVHQRPDLFYIPKFTCTRSPRADDEVSEFEYITIDDFQSLDADNVFLFTMQEGDRYYGYRKSSLTDPTRYPLLNCSPYGFENVKNLNATFVLVEGDWNKGLLSRNNSLDLQQRTLVNQKVFEDFYSQDWFLKKMNIIHFNKWPEPEESAGNLCDKIINTITSGEHERTFNRAA